MQSFRKPILLYPFLADIKNSYNLDGFVKKLNLNPAIDKFTGDARHQWRRRINILQAIDNEADSVKLPIPKGKENEKNNYT